MSALASLPRHRIYTCARCGHRTSRTVLSKHTHHRYCADIDACTRRARRNQRKGNLL